MTCLRALSAAAFALLFAPALVLAADAPIAVGDPVGDSPEAVRQTLTGRGCEVRKTDREDGMLEVYAICGGARLELYVRDGKIARIKSED